MDLTGGRKNSIPVAPYRHFRPQTRRGNKCPPIVIRYRGEEGEQLVTQLGSSHLRLNWQFRLPTGLTA